MSLSEKKSQSASLSMGSFTAQEPHKSSKLSVKLLEWRGHSVGRPLFNPCSIRVNPIEKLLTVGFTITCISHLFLI